MCVICYRSLPIFLLLGLLTTIQPALAAPANDAPPPQKAHTTYPQIVRLSYVEGDVRISRGKPGEKADEQESGNVTGWEQAVVNLPLQAGYSLVTGKGRAEIELEDASTVYLAENSVLTFDQLSSTAGVPYTELSLLSGTATINVRLTVAGDEFRLNTPTNHIALTYPHAAVWRVNSYLDAVSITQLQDDLTVRQSGAAPLSQALLGKTLSFNAQGRLISVPASPDATAFAEWDRWVAGRIAARHEAMSAEMKQAGLAQPLPGLDQLGGQGTFFSCAPYGTCWAPTNGWDGKSPADTKPASQPAAPVALKPAALRGSGAIQPARLLNVALSSGPASELTSELTNDPPAQPSGKAGKAARVPGQSPTDAYLATHPGATFYTEDYAFPCIVDPIRELVAVDPITGRETIVDSEFDSEWMDSFLMAYPHRGFGLFTGYDAYWGYRPWDWTVCHAGSWVRWQHRYVWVAGTNRHHRCPVRWVRSGRHEGYVPIHPRDVAGKLPLNLKDGFFHVDGKHGTTLERVNFEQGKELSLLTQPPREFRSAAVLPLMIAEVPHAEAHSAWASERAAATRNAVPGAGSVAHGTAILNKSADPSAAKGLAETRHEGVPITFDRKTQSFSVARQVGEPGGRTATVATPLGGGRAYSGGGNGNGYSGARASGSGGYSGGGSQSRSASSGGGGYSGGGSRGGNSGGGGGGGNASGGGGSHGGGGGGGGGGGSAPSGGVTHR